MIGVIGLSHKSAPVNIREKFSLDEDDSSRLSAIILSNKYIEELVILSTCNRTEIYFKADDCCSPGAFHIIMKSLRNFSGTGEETDNYFYRFGNDEAIRHLFRVVSSLESMVLGEYQIVSQVKEAYRVSKENKTVGRIFKRLFSKALETGKLVRTKTAMSNGAFSVSYAAVEKCNEQFTDLQQKKILLIGAGETGELVIKNLYKKGCKNITITNRTSGKAEELATRYQGKAIPFSSLMEGIHEAEIIVSSVAGKDPILDAQKVQPVMNGFPHVVMIDLGVPRNINPDVSQIPGISLINVDDLEEVVAGNMEKKQAYVSVAESIIAEKTTEFSDWLSVQNLTPAINEIISAVNRTSESELAVFRKNLSEADYQQIERYSKQLSEKITGSLIKNMKKISDNGRKTEYVKVITDLFSSFSHER